MLLVSSLIFEAIVVGGAVVGGEGGVVGRALFKDGGGAGFEGGGSTGFEGGGGTGLGLPLFGLGLDDCGWLTVSLLLTMSRVNKKFTDECILAF